MIAFDTNVLVRMLVEDDPDQAEIVKNLIIQTEANSGQILILSEKKFSGYVVESLYSNAATLE